MENNKFIRCAILIGFCLKFSRILTPFSKQRRLDHGVAAYGNADKQFTYRAISELHGQYRTNIYDM